MNVLRLFFIVTSPLWVSEAKLNIAGLSEGIRALVKSIGKTMVKSSLNVIKCEALERIQDTVTRKLSIKSQEDNDINLAVDDTTDKENELGKFLDNEFKCVFMLIYVFQ